MNFLNKLPDDLLTMIINLSSFECCDCKHYPTIKYHSFNITHCTVCNNPLCSKHAKMAKRWGKFSEHWTGKCIMCDDCCWGRVCYMHPRLLLVL